jgi:hypothetical protein
MGLVVAGISSCTCTVPCGLAHNAASYLTLPTISRVKHYCFEARPNNVFQPTPLRGPKIGGILQSGFVLTLVLTYSGGAAER